MSKVHDVLLVPAEGDPHGLLAEGPCGARPPMAWSGHAVAGWRSGWPPAWASHRALVLAWGGKPVPVSDGWLRCSHITVPLMEQGRGFDVLRDALADVGKVVLLDAEGREVNPFGESNDGEE